MKYLTIIASSITLISSYSLAMEKSCKPHSILLHNNLFNDGITIANSKNKILPGKTEIIKLSGNETEIRISVDNSPTIFAIKLQKPLPKNLHFNRFNKNGRNYIRAYSDNGHDAQHYECK